MKTFKEHMETTASTEVNEVNNKDWENAYTAMKGIKTSVGIELQQMIKDYQEAIIKVQMLPSAMKLYFEEEGIEFPEKKAVNDLIDCAGKLKLITNAKLK